MNCFCNAETDFHELSFFAEKVILSLNAQNHFFRASKNTHSVLVANKANYEMWGHRCSKASSQSEKVAKCNFKSKAQLTWKIILLM